MHIAVLSNTAWYIHNFRLNLMRALAEMGHHVLAVSPTDEYVGSLEASGFRHREWRLKNSGINPAAELGAIWRLYKILKSEKIDVLLAYTPKGNIYGAFAARLSGAAVVNNVSGLGRAFIKQGPLSLLVKLLYKLAFHRSVKIFFQNEEDMKLFIEQNIVNGAKVLRLPGSGVDVRRFMPRDDGQTDHIAAGSSAMIFLLIARMLWDKGVGIFVEAARTVKEKYPACRFQLLGFLGVDNPASISSEQIDLWEKEGIIEYLGAAKDVVPLVQLADCVVLPSYYREGVPRALLEAASMTKPIITTDMPGCRDAVDDEVTGYICRVKDSADLAVKMIKMVELPGKVRQEMGRQGRLKMEKEFDEQIVIDRYLTVLAEIGVTAGRDINGNLISNIKRLTP